MKDHIQPAIGGNYRREVGPHEVPRLTAACYYYFYLRVFVLLGHGFATMVRNITPRLFNCSCKWNATHSKIVSSDTSRVATIIKLQVEFDL